MNLETLKVEGELNNETEFGAKMIMLAFKVICTWSYGVRKYSLVV